MAKLPRREDLGATPALPSGRSGRPIATYRIDDDIRRAGNASARAIANIGTTIDRALDAREKTNEFEAERKFQEFKWNEKLQLDEQLRNIEPGQAEGFADRWAESYQERAKGFFQEIPDSQKSKYDLKLFGAERDLYGSAATYARQEQRRYSLNQINDLTNTYISRATTLEDLDKVKTDYSTLVQANPFLSPIEKDEAARKGYARLEEAHVTGRIERGEDLPGILRDIRGQGADTDQNPELRARPFRGTVEAGQPTTRFSSKVNTAINEAASAAGVEPGLLATFAQIESSGRPNARTGSYKGLFQLSESEFKKYGGEGNIYDPVANANAAALKLKAETQEFEAQYGREATPLDLYMIHQQGKGGYEAHTSNPDAPAWENMASTAEGRQKGKRWAKQAIWGNIPDDVKKQFPGGVESVTSADFFEIWQDKVDRFSGGVGSTSAGKAEDMANYSGPYKNLPAERRNALISNAKVAHRAIMQQEIKDSAEQIRRTGEFEVDEEGRSSLDRAEAVLTKNQFEKAKLDWKEAEFEYEAMNGLDYLAEGEMQARLDEIAPRAGDEFYQLKAKAFDKAVRQVETLRKERDNDPAGSVGDFPEVKEARDAVAAAPEDPAAFQELARARIDAQESIGIPEGLRSPITKSEARIMIAPIKGLEGKALKSAIEDMVSKAEETYGPYARGAAVAAVELAVRDKDTAERTIGIITRSLRGLPPTAAQQRELEVFEEASMAMRAFSLDPVEQFTPTVAGPASMPQQNPMAYYGKRPPRAAIEALVANPSLASEFDAYYGEGAAGSLLAESAAIPLQPEDAANNP